jgi:hypothetical protein
VLIEPSHRRCRGGLLLGQNGYSLIKGHELLDLLLHQLQGP